MLQYRIDIVITTMIPADVIKFILGLTGDYRGVARCVCKDWRRWMELRKTLHINPCSIKVSTIVTRPELLAWAISCGYKLNAFTGRAAARGRTFVDIAVGAGKRCRVKQRYMRMGCLEWTLGCDTMGSRQRRSVGREYV